MQEMKETGVRSLGWEDPLEEGMATPSSILAWRITWTEEPGGLQSIASHRVGHNWSNLALTYAQPWRVVAPGQESTSSDYWSRMRFNTQNNNFQVTEFLEVKNCLFLLCNLRTKYRSIIWGFSSVQSLSCVWLCDHMDCSMPGLPVHHQLRSLLKLMSIELVMPSKHLILCCPLLLLTSLFPKIKVFSNVSVLRIRWPKYWSFSISPSNEYSGLISFRSNWFDLLPVQGTLKSFPASQVESINTLALSFFMVPHTYMTTGKTTALTIWTSVGKVMSAF